MQDDITKRIARWVALGALFLIPLTPLIVANSFFFPFITGKAFFFRILVEITIAAWVVLALLDREYRPRFSWVGGAVIAFVLWMGIADAFALNAAKAFWSNFERMEGWVFLAHLLGLFFASSSVLRAEKKWRAWFLASLAVSLVISGYALLQLGGSLAIHQGSTRIDATLGNSAYLAIYFLFSVFVAIWLALTEKSSWLKWSLIALAALETILIFFTETRGTVIGLTLGFALAAALAALTAGRTARRYASGALVLIVVLVGGFYLARDSSFVQENHVLQRVASISPSDGKVRFTIWSMALEGVKERPIIGWGQEGFNYIFNKYYEPSMYKQEQWFDRAHNAFIDWLTAGGIPAFLLYLSLFGSALVLLWRSSELSRPERIALTAALVGYAVHNVFVFDNLYSYIYFFAILALIDSQVGRPIPTLENAPVLTESDAVTYALPVAVVIGCTLIWFVNVPGMQVASKLITALSPSSAGVSGNIAAFQDLVTRPSFAAQEIREQLVSFAASVVQSPAPTMAEKQQAVSLAASEMQKQIDAYPLDAREHLQLSYVYRTAGDGASALKEIRTALTLSPKKISTWIEAGVTEWDLGNVKGAQSDFNTAYELAKQFPDLAEYAAAGNIAVGDIAAADTILLDAYGTTTVESKILPMAWFSLAGAYYTAGDRASAIATIKKAIALFPGAAESGAAAIKQIEEGK